MGVPSGQYSDVCKGAYPSGGHVCICIYHFCCTLYIVILLAVQMLHLIIFVMFFVKRVPVLIMK